MQAAFLRGESAEPPLHRRPDPRKAHPQHQRIHSKVLTGSMAEMVRASRLTYRDAASAIARTCAQSLLLRSIRYTIEAPFFWIFERRPAMAIPK
jgi:hypothetical protein